MRADRPSIRLRLNDQIEQRRIAEILHGMEEEGVPVEVTQHQEKNPLLLAHQASLESRLGVGVGVGLDFVVITTEKLPADRPYLVENLNRAQACDRALGANAARLVKRMPLTDLTAI